MSIESMSPGIGAAVSAGRSAGGIGRSAETSFSETIGRSGGIKSSTEVGKNISVINGKSGGAYKPESNQGLFSMPEYKFSGNLSSDTALPAVYKTTSGEVRSSEITGHPKEHTLRSVFKDTRPLVSVIPRITDKKVFVNNLQELKRSYETLVVQNKAEAVRNTLVKLSASDIKTKNETQTQERDLMDTYLKTYAAGNPKAELTTSARGLTEESKNKHQIKVEDMKKSEAQTLSKTEPLAASEIQQDLKQAVTIQALLEKTGTNTETAKQKAVSYLNETLSRKGLADKVNLTTQVEQEAKTESDPKAILKPEIKTETQTQKIINRKKVTTAGEQSGYSDLRLVYERDEEAEAKRAKAGERAKEEVYANKKSYIQNTEDNTEKEEVNYVTGEELAPLFAKNLTTEAKSEIVKDSKNRPDGSLYDLSKAIRNIPKVSINNVNGIIDKLRDKYRAVRLRQVKTTQEVTIDDVKRVIKDEPITVFEYKKAT